MPFTVTAAQISVGPGIYDGECGPPDAHETMAEQFVGSVYVPGTTPGGTVTYRWRLSDGTITAVHSTVIGPTSRPQFYGVYVPDGPLPITGEWAVDPATADGSSKWAELEVLTPSHLLSPPEYFNFKCEYSIRWSSASSSGGNGGTPPMYNCLAGGDQTFTFKGEIDIFPDPHSHVVSYHWLRADGTQGPEQSVTFAPGQFTAPVQPDSVVMTYAEAVANGGQTLREQIVVDVTPPIAEFPAEYLALCIP